MNFEKYVNRMHSPDRRDYTKYHYVRNGKVFTEKVRGAVEEVVFDKVGYNKEREEYQKEESRLAEEFKKDLFADLGITNNPKADKLFNIAWEAGHCGGYREIYKEALNLVDLIK